MQLILERLKTQCHQSSRNCNYYLIWHKFNAFVLKLDVRPKSWEQRVSLYGAFLVNQGIQSSTLKSYISAIKCVVCTDDYDYVWDDSKVLLHTLTKACKITNDTVTPRLPIRIGLLEIILFQCERLFVNQWYCEIMYKTLFILAYYGMFRIGELAKGDHSVRAKNVHVGKNKKKILMILYSSKTHNKESYPQEVRISAENDTELTSRKSKNFCPFKLARRFMDLRGGFNDDEDIFFTCSDGSPVFTAPSQKCVVKTPICSKFESTCVQFPFFQNWQKL